MRSILFWGLFPFTIPQALLVRKNAPRFAAASGPQQGIVGSGADRKRLAAIGDSIIAGVGAQQQSRGLAARTAEPISDALQCQIGWQSVGSIGATSLKVLHQLVPKLSSEAFDFIAVSVGVNDVTSLSTRKRFANRLDQLLVALRAHSPSAVIAVAGIPPLRGFPLLPQPLRALFGIRGQSFDEVMQEVIAKHSNVIHVPLDFDPTPDKFSADGFHPSEESYREFGRGMGLAMLDALSTPAKAS
jgi:lysophospholipase L1-like esterase